MTVVLMAVGGILLGILGLVAVFVVVALMAGSTLDDSFLDRWNGR